MASDIPDHHCPGCGTPQRSFERYPWYFCQDCLSRASDKAGTILEFANAGIGGGLVWRYQGDKDWRDAVAVACQIMSRPVIVHEARFGGVVAEPLQSGPLPSDLKIVDLRY